MNAVETLQLACELESTLAKLAASRQIDAQRATDQGTRRTFRFEARAYESMYEAAREVADWLASYVHESEMPEHGE